MIRFHSRTWQNPFNVRLMLVLIGCLFSAHAPAQGSQTLANRSVSACDAGLQQVDSIKLCASKKFKQPAFKTLSGDKPCGSKYRKLAGLPFCIINSPKAKLSMKRGYFVLSKSEQNGCRGNFNRAPSSRVCIDNQLALSEKNGELKLVSASPPSCSASDINNVSACKKTCAPGYVRSPSYAMCVEFGLAKRGHPDLKNSDTNCGGSKYWRTYSNRGLCLPRLALQIVNRELGDVIAVRPGNGSCGTGQIPQVLDTAVASTQASQGAATSFELAPVVACSPPGRIK